MKAVLHVDVTIVALLMVECHVTVRPDSVCARQMWWGVTAHLVLLVTLALIMMRGA